MFPELVMKLFRLLDIMIVLLIVAIGVAFIFLFEGSRGARAEVYVSGRKAAVFSLEGPEQMKEIQTRIGTVRIQVGKGSIHVVESPCKQKICILQGEIQHTHEKIICVPARMVITIVNPDESNDSQPKIDAVSY